MSPHRRVIVHLAAALAVATAGCAAVLSLGEVGYGARDGGAEASAGDATNDPDAGARDGADAEPVDSGMEILARGLVSPTALVADQTNLYWIAAGASGGVMTCALPSCSTPAMLVPASNLVALAVRDGVVFFGGAGGYKLIAADGGVRDLSAAPASALVPAGNQLYAAESTRIAVCSLVNDAGCIAGSFSLGAPSSNLIADTQVLWQQGADIVSCPLGVCPGPTAIARGFPAPSLLARGASTIGWTAGGGVWLTDRATLDASADSGAVYSLASGLAQPAGIAMDGDVVYVSTNGDGTVRRLGRFVDAGAILTGLPGPSGVAIAGGFLYVACTGDGTIRKVPK